MRIISSFHDYYDGVMRSVFDKDTLYIRKPIQIISKLNRFVIEGRYDRNISCKTYTVFVAGKVYPSITIKYNLRTETRFYSADDVIHYIQEHSESKYNYFKKSVHDYFNFFTQSEIEKAFSLVEQPVFVMYYDYIKRCYIFDTEKTLESLEFQKIISPYEIFQEIYQYICNQASPEKPIPHVSDEILAEAKGFDKYSFRKAKSKC